MSTCSSRREPATITVQSDVRTRSDHHRVHAQIIHHLLQCVHTLDPLLATHSNDATCALATIRLEHRRSSQLGNLVRLRVPHSTDEANADSLSASNASSTRVKIRSDHYLNRRSVILIFASFTTFAQRHDLDENHLPNSAGYHNDALS